MNNAVPPAPNPLGQDFFCVANLNFPPTPESPPPSWASNILARAINMNATTAFQWRCIDKPSRESLSSVEDASYLQRGKIQAEGVHCWFPLLPMFGPQAGTTLLVFLANTLPPDGIRYATNEQVSRAPVPEQSQLELEVASLNHGFCPPSPDASAEPPQPQLTRYRKRFRLSKGGIPNLCLFYWGQTPPDPSTPSTPPQWMTQQIRNYPLPTPPNAAVQPLLGYQNAQKMREHQQQQQQQQQMAQSNGMPPPPMALPPQIPQSQQAQAIMMQNHVRELRSFLNRSADALFRYYFSVEQWNSKRACPLQLVLHPVCRRIRHHHKVFKWPDRHHVPFIELHPWQPYPPCQVLRSRQRLRSTPKGPDPLPTLHRWSSLRRRRFNSSSSDALAAAACQWLHQLCLPPGRRRLRTKA